MLIRKMLREMKTDSGQFFSVFLLSFLAVCMFTLLKASNVGAYHALNNFYQETNLADGWLYGEGFSDEDLKKVRELPDVTAAQLRMQVTGTSVGQNNAQIEIFLEDENLLTKPYVFEGGEFNPTDTEHLWLSERFAKEWDLSVGDDFSVTYNGVSVEKKIAGLIASPEFSYMCADTDLDVDFKNIAYVYMSYKGFPVREYVEHLITAGKITANDVLEHTKLLDAVLQQLEANGLTKDAITQEMLLKRIDGLSDEKLLAMMPYTQMILSTDKEDVLSLENEISEAVNGDYAVFVDKNSIAGMKVLADELSQHEQFAYIFTMVFVLIALLVIMTTMSRMVANQRTQIGTMNALGMKNSKIMRHYLSYSFVISSLGAAFGLIIGPLWWGQALTELFESFYTIPEWKSAYDNSFFIAAAVVVLICTGTSYLSCRRLLRVKPSEALRPAPPKSGKNCIFEKLPFWKRLGFTVQYNLRDISRARLRAFMGIFGTACGMMIMACGLACNTTLDNVYDWNFGKLQNYDYNIQFAKDITTQQADAFSEKYGGELIMAGSVEVAAKNHALSGDKKTTGLAVTEGKGFYGITNVRQEEVSIPEGTIAISSKLALSLGVGVGDGIYWHIYDKNEWYRATVGVISRNPTSSGITMLRKDFEETGNKFLPAFLYTNEDATDLERTNSLITATHSKTDRLEAFMQSMQIMYVMVGVLIVFAAILIIVVLYNSGNLSFNERIKEFATLKVLGFESKQIQKILTIQNLWLSVIGIFLGAPFAKIILQYMFDSNGDSYDYEAVISAGDYIYAAIFVLGVSALAGFFFSKRIRRLDMVEVLKGME